MKTVWVVEYRHRRKGKNKNRLLHRWSRWCFYSVLTIHRVALARARNIRMRADGFPGIYPDSECDARVVPYDRRKR
jgi:hypothetical protein